MGGTGSYDPYRPDPSGGSGGPDEQIDCSALRFPATIQVADEPVAVTSGEVLEVLRVELDGVMVVAAINETGQLIGTIIDGLDRLLPCLTGGVAFVADVLTVNYGTPSVRVTAAQVARCTTPELSLVGSVPVGQLGTLQLAEPGRELPIPMRVTCESAGQTAACAHPRVCEIRTLLRVGVQLTAMVTASGTARLQPLD